MRYEEMSLPLAGGLFQIRFHQQVTVLAGIARQDRSALVDAFANAAAGQVPGGTLVFRDRGGRRIVVRDGQLNYLDDGTDAAPAALGMHADARTMRNLLYVGAEDLGLPRAEDDPSSITLQTDLLAARAALAQANRELTAAHDARTRRDRALAELAQTEETLASLGTPTDRYLHDRARTLVELERVRSVLAAVDASDDERRRDERLLAVTDQVQGLADEWSEAGAALDQLVVRFRDRERLDSAQLAELVDIPDSVPAGLSHAIANYESAVARGEELASDLARLQRPSRPPTPKDPRVMVLGTLNQDTLWMSHRRMVLASEALAAACEEEDRIASVDPGALQRAEAAHTDAIESAARAERLWLRGMVVVTVLVCLAAMLPLAGYSSLFTPALLAAAAIAFTGFVLLPKARARGAEKAAATIIAETGAASIEEYRRRFTDDPNSARWRRADLIVDDYESAMAEWRELVGDMSVDEVGAIEDEVQAWASAHDPAHIAAQRTSVERSLAHAESDRESSSRALQAMLVPLGLELDELPVAIGAAVHERIQLGRFARLQLQLGEAEEAEAKLKDRLDELLCSIGFEAGTLEARIGAFGWAIDGARQRAKMRAESTDRDALEAKRTRLERALAVPPPAAADAHDAPTVDTESPHVAELRARRDALRKETASIQLGNEGALSRQVAKLEAHTASLQSELDPDAGMLVAHPVDHLVETLVRFRPSWPASVDDPMPALIDDPFRATPLKLREQLLDALCEVAKATQVILLTDDVEVTRWARAQAGRGRVSLLEPSRESA